MPELILHHYPQSPFAEKVRLILGFKGLSWRSVHIAPMMPKPDLTALTGGYRKTPVLQVGADIYCDTALIARRLEQENASPTLFPQGLELVAQGFAAWADAVVFPHSVALVFQPASAAVRFAQVPPQALEALVADRGKLFTGGSASRMQADQARHQWPVIIGRVDQQLQGQAGGFLFGEPSIADFALAHPLWFLMGSPVTALLVDSYPAVSAWLARVAAFGHGTSSPMTADEALDIARTATPAPLPDEVFEDPNGFKPGQQVTIAATDYGVDPVAGELLFAGREALILRRTDARGGTVHVHFPRMGFRIEAQ
ncbi:glutathione S-transferase family protein [Pseudomonas sp. SDO528_S397]